MKIFYRPHLQRPQGAKFKFGFLLHWGQKFAIQPLLGIQWHVIPRWKGIALGVKMATNFVPNNVPSGHRAQKCDFGRVIYSQL